MSSFSWQKIWSPAWSLGLVFRELIGWIIVAMGFYVFRLSLTYLDHRQVIEGLVSAIIGYVIFRAGFQLIKVAVAARAFVRQHHVSPN